MNNEKIFEKVIEKPALDTLVEQIPEKRVKFRDLVARSDGWFGLYDVQILRSIVDFLVSKFIDAALNNKDILIYGDGSQTRTFCYIDDNIEATTRIFKDSLYLNDIINIGNSEEISVLDLAKRIIKITESSSKIVHANPLKEGDMTRRKPDNSKMLKILNRNLLTIEEGVANILEFKYSIIK